jgi:hypothetical protein
MRRLILRAWHSLRGEIALGFLIASVFWAGVPGWQAAYAPTDAEKQKCYEAAHNAGHKNEECKSFWEKTTSDPVALFTLVLAISTIGLWVATVFLYRAGEKQFQHARRSAASQSRDMQASIAEAKKSADATMLAVDSERAWLSFEKMNTVTSASGLVDGVPFRRSVGFAAEWKNRGRSPAIKTQMFTDFRIVPATTHRAPRFEAIGGSIKPLPQSVLTEWPPAR